MDMTLKTVQEMSPEQAQEALRQLEARRAEERALLGRREEMPAEEVAPEAAERKSIEEPQTDFQKKILEQGRKNMQPENVLPQMKKALAPKRLLPMTLDFLKDAQAETDQTIAEFAGGTANLLLRGLTHLINLRLPANKQLQPYQFKHPEFDKNIKNKWAKVVGLLAGFIPVAGLTELTGGLPLVGKVGQLSERFLGAKPGMGFLRRVGLKGLRTGLETAPYGAIFAAATPGAQLTPAMLSSAAMGGLTGAAVGAVPTAIKMAKETIGKFGSLFKSPRELRQFQLFLAKNKLKLPITDITGNPYLRYFYHNLLRTIPGSGVAGAERTAVAKAHYLLEDFLTHLKTNPETKEAIDDVDIIPQLKQELRTYVNSQEAEKRRLYGIVNEKANISNFRVHENLPNLQKTAKDILEEDEVNRKAGTASVLEPTALAQVEKAATVAERPEYGFNQAIQDRSTYNQEKIRHERELNHYTSSIYKRLHGALTNDLNELPITATKNIKNLHKGYELLDALNAANKHFKEYVLPTREGAIYRFLNFDKGGEKIHSALQTTAAKSILEGIGDFGRRLIAHRTFAGKTPLQVKRLFEDTLEAKSPGLLRRLFSAVERGTLRTHNKLAAIGGKAALELEKPPTGKSLEPILRLGGFGTAAVLTHHPLIAAMASMPLAMMLGEIIRSPLLLTAVRKGHLLPIAPLVSKYLLPTLIGHLQVANQEPTKRIL
ncbi:MAG: hypothetical protein ACFFDN_00885 [Candidatus Hodarchaeota archaeon]